MRERVRMRGAGEAQNSPQTGEEPSENRLLISRVELI